MASNNSPQELVPLREPTYFILLSLASGPIHGYAIMKDVAFLSEERVVLSTSTLYSALKRLLDQGWIRREDEPAEQESGRPRKMYRLTRLGQRVLQADVARLESLLTAARQRAVSEGA